MTNHKIWPIYHLKNDAYLFFQFFSSVPLKLRRNQHGTKEINELLPCIQFIRTVFGNREKSSRFNTTLVLMAMKSTYEWNLGQMGRNQLLPIFKCLSLLLLSALIQHLYGYHLDSNNMLNLASYRKCRRSQFKLETMFVSIHKSSNWWLKSKNK